MRQVALALVLTLTLAGCGASGLPGAPVAGMSGDLGALAKRAATGDSMAAFEALAEKYVPDYDAKKAECREALQYAADYENGKPSSYRPLTAQKVALIEKYLVALAALKLDKDAITMGTLTALKDHADYAYPESGKGIYPQASAAHLRIFKKYMALVKAYKVRQQNVAISRFLGKAYGAEGGGAEQGVTVMETYLEALDKAGFQVRSENFALMNFSGRGGFPTLLGVMSFESGPGDQSAVGPAYAKKALPAVLKALDGKKRTATADDVADTLSDMAWQERKAAKK